MMVQNRNQVLVQMGVVSLFKIGDKVRNNIYGEGIINDIPNDRMAWVRYDEDPDNWVRGVKMDKLERIKDLEKTELAFLTSATTQQVIKANTKFVEVEVTETTHPIIRPKLSEQATGEISVKRDDNKTDYTMLTLEMIELVSKVRMFGAKKYARGNFKITGFKYTRSLAAVLRHVFAFLNGEDNDPESGLSHLGHAICCLEHIIYDSKHHPQNDDRK